MKQKRSYADEAKAIMNKYKTRLGDKFDKGDTLALEAMNQELTALRDQQEQQRIKESSVVSEADIQEFAKGGVLPEYQGPGLFSNQLNIGYGNIPYNFSGNAGFNLNDPSTFADFTGGVGDFDFSGGGVGAGGAAPFAMPGTDAGSVFSQASAGLGGDPSYTPYKSNVMPSVIGHATQGLGTILGNRPIDFEKEGLNYEYQEFTPSKVAPNLVDYSRGREQVMRERDLANAEIRRQLKGTGARGADALIAGYTGTQRGAGSAFEQSVEAQGAENARLKTSASQFNAAQAAQAAQINQRNRQYANDVAFRNAMINKQRRDAQIAGGTQAITGLMKDIGSMGQYDNMLQMMGDDYGMMMGDKGNWLNQLLGNPEMIKVLTSTMQSV